MSMAQETSESELLDAIKKLLKKSGHLDKLQAEVTEGGARGLKLWGYLFIHQHSNQGVGHKSIFLNWITIIDLTEPYVFKLNEQIWYVISVIPGTAHTISIKFDVGVLGMNNQSSLVLELGLISACKDTCPRLVD